MINKINRRKKNLNDARNKNFLGAVAVTNIVVHLRAYNSMLFTILRPEQKHIIIKSLDSLEFLN